MRSSDSLFSFFREGRMPREQGIPEYIETAISHVFLYPQRVYKIYKSDADFFNEHFRDISDHMTRKMFTLQDFEWNARLSHSVYLECWPVICTDGLLSTANSIDEADELVIVTRRIETENLLLHILTREPAAACDFYSLGEQFAEMEMRLQPIDPPAHISAYKDTESRIVDLEHWLPAIEDRAFNETFWADGITYLKEQMHVVHATQYDLLPALDTHALNAFVEQGTLLIFDSFPPKGDWQYGASPINIFRFAVDIYAYKGEAAFRDVMRGYARLSTRKPMDESLEMFWLVYAGLIMASYLQKLRASDPRMMKASMQYEEFLKAIIKHAETTPDMVPSARNHVDTPRFPPDTL